MLSVVGVPKTIHNPSRFRPAHRLPAAVHRARGRSAAAVPSRIPRHRVESGESLTMGVVEYARRYLRTSRVMVAG